MYSDFNNQIRLPSCVKSIMDKLTVVSYGGQANNWSNGSYQSEGFQKLRKVELLSQPTEKCQPSFPNGTLNGTFITCVSVMGFSFFLSAKNVTLSLSL